MPDSYITLNNDPDSASQIPGATDLSGPPVSITGMISDYANRPQPVANSLGLVMDDQQMRDAGVHPEQAAAQPTSMVIDATGQSGKPSADGVAEAFQKTDWAQTGSHGLGYGVGRLAGAAETAPLMEGLKGLTKAYAYPLTAAEGIAHGVGDMGKGPAGEVVLGNAVRTGLVMGATALGEALGGPFLGAPMANYAADKYLPDGATIGHGLVKSWSDPDVQRAMLSGP